MISLPNIGIPSNTIYAFLVIFTWLMKDILEQNVRLVTFIMPAFDGDRDAQFNLGSFYEDGIFIQQNIAKASFWYNLAASQGQNEAILKLKKSRQNKKS